MSEYKLDLAPLTETELGYFVKFHRNKTNKIKFLQAIVNIRGLFGNKGVQMCSTQLCKIIGVTSQSIRNYLKELEKLGFVQCLNKFWQKGEHAMIYTCVSKLLHSVHLEHNKQNLPKRLLNVAKRALKQYDYSKTRDEAWRLFKFATCNFQRVSKKHIAQVAKLYLGHPYQLWRDFSRWTNGGDIENMRMLNSTYLGREYDGDFLLRQFLHSLRGMHKFLGIKIPVSHYSS